MMPPMTERPIVPETVELLRNQINHLFETADTTHDYPQPGAFRLRGRPLYDITTGEGFAEIREIFARQSYTPIIRYEENERVALTGLPFLVEETPPNWRLSLFLFVATVLSTLWVGATSEPEMVPILEEAIEEGSVFVTAMANLWRGWPFCVSLMLILGAHELGHYFAARYHRVEASLPYFIPFPFSILGTLGAFIIQRGPNKNIRSQFDIGVAGPLAGMVFAVPITIYGLATSEVLPLPTTGTYYLEGNSILYYLIKFFVFGEFLPNEGYDVFINQFATAGWAGLLLTGLNLMPVSPLDGGRVMHVLFGEAFLRQIYWPIIISLAALGILTQSSVWFIYCLLFWRFGNRYDQPLDGLMPLDEGRRNLAIFTVFLFILVFSPIPRQIITP